MKIVVKEINQYISVLTNNKLSEFLVCLKDNNDNNLTCELVYGITNKNKRIVELVREYNLITVEEVEFEQFLIETENS
jgi:hypothetical protein